MISITFTTLILTIITGIAIKVIRLTLFKVNLLIHIKYPNLSYIYLFTNL